MTMAVIKQRLGDVLYKLTSQKFEDPGALGQGGGGGAVKKGNRRPGR